MALKTTVPKLLVGIVSIILAVPINAVLSHFLLKPNTAEITFENKSGLVIESIDVQLCTEKQQIKDLDHGESASLKFDALGDCHYSIKVFFGRDKFLNSEFGYITSGSNFKDFVTIEENNLVEGKQVTESDQNYLFKTIGLFLMYFGIVIILYKSFIILIAKLWQHRA